MPQLQSEGDSGREKEAGVVDKGKSKQESPSMGTGSEASEVGALRPPPKWGDSRGAARG